MNEAACRGGEARRMDIGLGKASGLCGEEVRVYMVVEGLGTWQWFRDSNYEDST